VIALAILAGAVLAMATLAVVARRSISDAPLTAGGVTMLLIGLVLIGLPGGCSLLFTGGILLDMLTRGPSPGGGLDLTGAVLSFSGVGFAFAALGIWLLRAGWRRRKGPPVA